MVSTPTLENNMRLGFTEDLHKHTLYLALDIHSLKTQKINIRVVFM